MNSPTDGRCPSLRVTPKSNQHPEALYVVLEQEFRAFIHTPACAWLLQARDVPVNQALRHVLDLDARFELLPLPVLAHELSQAMYDLQGQ